jgi:hypothetical protein
MHCIGFGEEAERVDLPEQTHGAGQGLDVQTKWRIWGLAGLDAFRDQPMDVATFQHTSPRAEEEQTADQPEGQRLVPSL